MATPRPSISQYFQIETADNVSYADDFANVQKSLESSKTSYVNQLKENAKEIQAMYNKVDQQLGEFTSGQSDLEFGNPSVNWDDTWRDSKTEYANLSRKIVAGQGTAADKQRISQLDAMVSSTTGNISNLTLLAQSAAEARQNPGKMGGIDMTSNSPDTLLAMEILNGNTKGSKKLVTNLKANPPTQAWEVYDNKGRLIWTKSTGDIEQMLEKGGSGGVTRVPDETQTMENNTSSLRLIGEDGKAGEINDDYYIKDASGRPALKTRVLSLPDGSKKIETYNELDMAAIKRAIELNIRAGAEGLSNSDKESAIALYNNVLGPGQRNPQTGEKIEFVPIEATNFVWEGDMKEKYEKAYVNYNLNNFLKKDRQVKTEAYKVPTVDKSKINRGKDIYNIDPDLETLKFAEPFRGKEGMMGPLNDQTNFDIDKFEKQATDMGFTVSTKTERRGVDRFGTPEVTILFEKTGKEVTISASDDIDLVKAKMKQAAGDVRTIAVIKKEIIANKIK